MRNFSILDSELNPNHALIISNSRKPLSNARIQNIKDYVSAGGHLILNAIEVYDDERSKSGAPFLDELGTRLYIEEIGYENFDEDSVEHAYRESISHDKKSKFTFDNYDKPTQVAFNSWRYLMDDSGKAVFIGGTDNAHHIIQYEMGQGVITVLSDMEFWNNYRIDDDDHALFLQQLTGRYEKLWIIYNPQVASLSVLLWQHADYVLVSSAVLLLLIIWYHQIKTGPVFPQFSNHSRKLLQHIEAASEFKWHNAEPLSLLEQVRNEIFTKIHRRSRSFQQLSVDKQIDQLHHWTLVSKAKLKFALYDNDTNSNTFVEQIQILQQVRNHLYGK